MKELFPDVFRREKQLFTRNLVPGKTVYGERLVNENGAEYRAWSPQRSKLAAALLNGLKSFPIRAGDRVLYLGCSEGTTPSHVSDVIGKKGLLFGVDVAERPMKNFIALCESRENMLPVLADANHPERYADDVGREIVDVLYQDVSQPNQAEIFCRNADAFLQKGRAGLLAIKARSIHSGKNPKKVFEAEIAKLRGHFDVKEVVDLKPFEKDHVMVFAVRK